MSKQTAIEMYSHLYGKEVTMDDRFETKVIWSEELAIKNNGKWIPKEITMNNEFEVEDDGLTDDEWIIREQYKQITTTAINFAKWLAKNWMSTWVKDRWMWEHIDGYKPENYKYHGEYYTEEELFEIYKNETR